MFDFEYFDIHSHPNFSQFDEDREGVLEEMRQKNVGTICVGTDVTTSKESIDLAHRYEHVWATVGLHPTDWKEGFDESEYRSLLGEERVVGVGEVGIDYYRSEEGKDEQRDIFARHIRLAEEFKLPLMLHGRPSIGTMDAYKDMLDVLGKSDVVGHVHFFAGDVEIARAFLDRGFTIGFDGPITFTKEYDDVVRFIPLDMLCAETDAPFASPVPFRGKRNLPLYVQYVVEALARIRDEDVEVVRKATVANAVRTFLSH